eukprot:TRINITY_DN2012_c0_g3_i1.p1 TRINITY_DN2012_c0_g3~~TRINITY_DN2012_c0_g3_i1.p1  ORF type:complete len:378 (+),score=162.46 TRINITY_DN2012_c0_g3_i1:117-1136(+)
MVRLMYQKMSASIKTEKPDKSIFTIADGLVQHLVADRLLGGTGIKIVGEEDALVEFGEKPYKIGGMPVPSDVELLVDQAVKRMGELNATLKGEHAYDQKNLTAFIDPIDGTREFATELGEQCSICIGFATESRPVAGVVYRPLSEPPTWCAGAKSESYLSEKLQYRERGTEPEPLRLLTTNGSISPYMQACVERYNYTRVKTGGAGNKVLMLIEGHGDIYFQDRGLSRWDTCAAEAALEAKGGSLVKLAPAVLQSKKEGYAYVQGEENSDFVAGQAALTPYNATGKIARDAPKQLASAVAEVRPYSNLQGLLATRDAAQCDSLMADLSVVAADIAPAFD